MFFDVLMFIFGFASVIRTLSVLNRSDVISCEPLTKIGTTLGITLFSIIFEWHVSAVVRSVSVIAVIFCLPMGALIMSQFYEMRMLDQLHHFIHQVILNMKMGASFRTSLEIAVQKQPTLRAQKWFAQILENVVFTQHENRKKMPQMLLKVIRELKMIDQDGFQAISRLENMHAWLKTLSDFRRRSGKALLHVRAQAVVIGLLYIAIVIFMSQFVGFEAIKKFLPLSAGLMSCGLIVILVLGRRMRWSF